MKPPGSRERTAHLTNIPHMHSRMYSIVLALLCISCTNSVNAKVDLPATCHPKDEKVFSLDESTVRTSNQIQYFSYNGHFVLALLNPFDSSIRIFNYLTGEQIERVLLSDIVGNTKIQGFTFADKSLYLYNYSDHLLFKYDIERREAASKTDLSKYLNQKEDYFPPAPYVGTCAPIIKSNNKVILSGFIAGEDPGENSLNRPSIIVVDEDNNSIELCVNYPSVYEKGNWGGGFCYRRPYCTDGPNSNVIISFAAYDSLVEYDIKTGLTKTHLAESSSISSIKPFSRHKGLSPSNSKEMKWYMTSPSYENVLYDPYRKVYYRFFRLPDTSYTPSVRGNNKPIGIIILNEKFEKQKEFMLPKNRYDLNNCFVSENGLHVQKMTESEDELVFDIFLP